MLLPYLLRLRPTVGTRNTLADRVQPTRSPITDGNSANSARIAGSNTSTADGLGGREYLGGSAAANARRTALRHTPNRLEIALIGIPSARCNRRISAQSSTASTPLTVAQGVHFQSAPRGQFSLSSDN
jgi:hypothetical protein